MILDGLLSFTGGSGGVGNNDGKYDVPTTGTQTSSNVLDIGVGTAANPALPASAANVGGRDIGIGDSPAMKLLVQVVVAFAGGTSLAVNVQGAPDSGSYTIGSYTTMVSGPVVNLAQLVAGARLLDIDFPRPAPGQVLPRYLQLQYVTVGTFTGGLQRLQGLIVLDRHDLVEQSNAVLGGYPPGIAIAN